MSHRDATAATQVDDEGARLSVQLTLLAADTVEIRYRLHNDGAVPLLVFDRGDRRAVLTGRQAAGAIGTPTFEHAGDGDVTLRHAARSLPDSPTGPTLPATPLARRLDAGDALEGTFRFQIPGASPRRLRWCLGVAPLADEDGLLPDGESAGLWRAGAAAVARQRLLCTPWFEVSTARFEDR
ncbi:hypothetical protein [Luteimonas kalidii]|uniref:Glycosyl-hydrolase 97 N-terminal domain-containing protein n=1 Tax=Luteimonas kalidii TaxID=3042025 RepID=A0ABT6JV39_9GAMM|nr:hypothetical protein [Luteimonas kalidii]MDH5834560.1 hypothetical protein [Luteimonas kalidii]